jgi:hypothetical protein
MSGDRHRLRSESRSLIDGETRSSDDRGRHESLVELVHILGRVKRLERQVLDVRVDLLQVRISSESVYSSCCLLAN